MACQPQSNSRVRASGDSTCARGPKQRDQFVCGDYHRHTVENHLRSSREREHLPFFGVQLFGKPQHELLPASSVSQRIFAQFLGVSVDAVQSWEGGVNTPSDMACRFMDEIRFNPEYWRKRLMESMSQKVQDPVGA